MCGIVCGQSSNPSHAAKLPQALAAIAHRGPDGQAFAQLGDAFFAHARLAIVGGAEGRQPLFSEKGDICACVNGEFYGHKAIAQGLRQRGHVLNSDSDSEILIHLYQEQGPDCLALLHGEFAFALYDARLRRWFCARDRAGAKPLCFWREGSSIIFASEAKALFAMGIQASLDRKALWHAQHLQYLPLGSTLFEGVHALPPASMLLASSGAVEVRAYWALGPGGDAPAMSFEEASDHAGALLGQAVSDRIPDAGIPWACHLSGGLDSSSVAALCAQEAQGGPPVECFTVSFPDDPFYDEAPFALATANKLGARLTVVEARYLDMFDAISEATRHAEGLSINGHIGAKRLLNRELSRQGFKVALTGEGADEIFMGYSHLKQDMLSAQGLTAMERGYLAGVQLPSGETMDLEPLRARLGFVPTWVAAKSSMAKKFEPLWHASFHFDENPCIQMLDECGIHEPPRSALKASSELWMRYCLGGYILKTLDDAQSMAFGIEGRLPFLDSRLMEFAWSLPDEMFFHGGIEKGLLRRCMRPLLPPEVVARTKQSFMSPPMHRSLSDPKIMALARERILGSQRLADLSVFDPKAIEAFLSRAASADAPAFEPILMTLLTLSSLCEEFSL